MIVIDASTILARILKDENNVEADKAVEHAARNGGFVPGNFHTEVVNGLVRAERRGRIDAVKAELMLAEVLNLPLTVDAVDPHVILAVARGNALTAYDAAYLALALERRISLATVDAALGSAAKVSKCRWKP